MLRVIAHPNGSRTLHCTARHLALSAVGTHQPDTASRVKGALLGSLVADALCLGSHYEYDAPTIKAAYGGEIRDYMAPGEHLGGTTHGVGWGRRNYHPGQTAGDGTDYGEYNVLMLNFLASRPPTAYGMPINLAELVPFWAERLCSDEWGAWRCSQSVGTLQQLQKGERDLTRLGGNSNAMSLRSAAAIAAFRDEDAAAAAARAMMFTHRAEEALVGGEFFTRVAWQVAMDGVTPREAIDAVGGRMSPWVQEQVGKGISKYEEATDPSKPLGAEEFCDDLAMTSMARLWDVGRSEPIKVRRAPLHPSFPVPIAQPPPLHFSRPRLCSPPFLRPPFHSPLSFSRLTRAPRPSAQVGKASPTEGTMPSSIYMILKYSADFGAAARANAMVGGDNAARGVAIGMVLGAYHGVGAIPSELQQGLHAWERSLELLERLLEQQ